MLLVVLCVLILLGLIGFAIFTLNKTLHEKKASSKHTDYVEIKAEHFIPLTRRYIRESVLDEAEKRGLDKQEWAKLLELFDVTYVTKYNKQTRTLLDDFTAFDPTQRKDLINSIPEETAKKEQENIITLLRDMLDKANFKPLTKEEFLFAMREDYLCTLPININWEQLDDTLIGGKPEDDEFSMLENRLMIYHRGIGCDSTEDYFIIQKIDALLLIGFSFAYTLAHKLYNLITKKEDPIETTDFFKADDGAQTNIIKRRTLMNSVNFKKLGLGVLSRKSVLQEPTFENIVLLYRTKTQTNKNAIFIKTFKHIPMADLEVIFPEKWVGLRPMDLLLFTITGCMGMLTAIVNLETDVSFTVGALSFLGFLGLAAKSFTDYRASMYYYQSVLLSSLYEKSLDSHSGVFLSLLEQVKQQEFNESVLAYFMLSGKTAQTEKEVDSSCEHFLWSLQESFEHKRKVDFESDDALAKLEAMGLVSSDVSDAGVKQYSAIPVADAIAALKKQNAEMINAL